MYIFRKKPSLKLFNKKIIFIKVLSRRNFSVAPQLLLRFFHPYKCVRSVFFILAKFEINQEVLELKFNKDKETCLLDESEIYAVPVNFRAKICVFLFNSQNTLIVFHVVFYSDIC